MFFGSFWTLFPPFFSAGSDFGPGDRIVFRTEACFAHKGMTQAGLIDGDACRIYERIGGWFDAMEVKNLRAPDLSRCLKHRGQDCVVIFEFTFP